MGRGVTPSNGVFPTMQDVLNARVGSIGRGAIQRNNKALMAKARQEAAEATKQRVRQASRRRPGGQGTSDGAGSNETPKATLTRFTRFTETLNSYSLMQARERTFSFREYLAQGGSRETDASVGRSRNSSWRSATATAPRSPTITTAWRCGRGSAPKRRFASGASHMSWIRATPASRKRSASG